jgi:hypothetical protein
VAGAKAIARGHCAYATSCHSRRRRIAEGVKPQAATVVAREPRDRGGDAGTEAYRRIALSYFGDCRMTP